MKYKGLIYFFYIYNIYCFDYNNPNTQSVFSLLFIEAHSLVI